MLFWIGFAVGGVLFGIAGVVAGLMGFPFWMWRD